VILIAGGKDKQGDLQPLKELIRHRVRGLILIGEAKERMARELGPLAETVIARTLEEILTTYNQYDEHGVSNDMTKDQLNDLIEYLKTL
jgi:UDP-N-acetylmuramoylalanine--D-glutamate ligase